MVEIKSDVGDMGCAESQPGITLYQILVEMALIPHCYCALTPELSLQS